VFFFRTYTDPGQDWTHVRVVSRVNRGPGPLVTGRAQFAVAAYTARQASSNNRRRWCEIHILDARNPRGRPMLAQYVCQITRAQ
jgi:hypothetical protein